MNIYPTPVWISVKLLPVINNSHMEGTVSQIFYIAPSFYFMIKNGKIVVIMFLTFTLHFKKKSYINILRQYTMHIIYLKNNQ